MVIKSDGEVLESWAIVPSIVSFPFWAVLGERANVFKMNFGGATDRPDLAQVWENAKAKLGGEKPVFGSYKKMGMMGLILGKV